ncbi:MAG TPA: hypothetical protein VGD79_06840 [Thermoanaerobaculia bacterium]|jgi:DUF4097 and DUF4098 domain-containing protein YvlB
MRRLAIALTVTLAATTAFAHDGHDHRSSAEECSERSTQFGDEPTFVKKEVINASNLRSIKASVTNAPISFEGGNSAGYTITVCKAATVQADLEQIRVTLNGNELRADGPDESHKRRWTVMYHIRAPRNADIDVEAENGPVAFRDIDGKVVARAQNGPLSLSNVTGEIDAATSNGPISINGGSGTMKVKASNGPLTVDLDGASWNGTLDASTKNGPLTVRVPRNFNSGVVIEAKGHGPISCHAADCERGWRSDDDGEPRRIELGNGPATVHLSTVNGPVTVKDQS